uniref:Uncharacterized protein n=1 Tax=Takifugu rubripes TaxID=31033 RepID=A0A3B5K0B9_TAKRU
MLAGESNGVCVNNSPGYSCYCTNGYVYNSKLLECVDHDECEEESCVGGACVNTVGSYYCSCPPPLLLDDTQRTCVNSSHITVGENENLSVCWQRVTTDLVCQSPLLGPHVTFTSCCCFYGEGWGMQCALCPSTDSVSGGSTLKWTLAPLMVPLSRTLPCSYDRMSTAEDCGILHGCENGRCIRVSEGYTCDCYHGYKLDMTSMTCTDTNECEDGVDGVDSPCVNARCVNTEGSFRCICLRGFVMTEPNHCVKRLGFF